MESLSSSLRILSLLLTLLSFKLSAQEGRLELFLYDAGSKAPISNASLLLLDSHPQQGSLTDSSGRAALHLPSDQHFAILVQHQGYQDHLEANLQIPSSGYLKLELDLYPSIDSLEVVNVIAQTDGPRDTWTKLSAVSIRLEKSQRLAASLSDPARAALTVAGVIGANDEGNELIIRGNGPRQVQWRLQGVPIPNPNHFGNGRGSQGGAVLMLSTNSLAATDFLRSNFPAQYGNALGGVMDLELATANPEQTSIQLEAGVLGFRSRLEIPISRRSALLLNYRYSNLHLLDRAGFQVSGTNVAPRYQDLSCNYSCETENYGSWSLWFLGGHNAAGTEAEGHGDQAHPSSREHREEQSLYLGGLRHRLRFAELQAFMQTSVAYSAQEADHYSGYRDSLNQAQLLNREESEDQSIHFHSFFQQMPSKRWKWRAGIEAEVPFSSLNRQSTTKASQKLSAHHRLLALYAQAGWQLRPSWYLQLGLRSNYRSLNQEINMEPRLALNYQSGSHQKWTLAFSKQSSPEDFSLYESQPEPHSLKSSSAWHSGLAYSQQLAAGLSLKVEAYYQNLQNVPVAQRDSLGLSSLLNAKEQDFNEPYHNQSEGRNYGLELSLEQSMHHGLYWQIAASLSRSEFKRRGQDFQESRFHIPYQVQSSAGKEWSWGAHYFSVNLGLRYHANLKAIPIDLAKSQAQAQAVYDRAAGYAQSYPDYLRLDLGISYRKKQAHWWWKISLDIQNLSNRANVLSHYYHPHDEKVAYHYQNGLLPVLAYQIGF